MLSSLYQQVCDKLVSALEPAVEPRTPVTHIAGQPGVRTLGDFLRARARRSGDRPAFYDKDLSTGRWRLTTWQQFLDRAAQVAAALVDLRIPRGACVSILGPTQPHWPIYDFGAQLAGLVSVGIYPQQSVEQLRYLLSHSESRVVFVADPVELENILAASQGLTSLVAIVPWSDEVYTQFRDRDPRLVSPARFAGSPLSPETLEQIQASINPEDTALLIYTSGTTGPPKGAMISHRNLCALFGAAQSIQQMYEEDCSLSFLPMAHAAERIFACYGRVSAGVPTYYASSIAAVLSEIREVKPTLFGSVPRIFEKAFTKIHTEVERQPRAVQALFAWAVRVGKQRTEHIMNSQPIPPMLAAQYRVAERLVFRKIRDAFGGRIRYFIVGAAPTPLHIQAFFWAAGMPIFEVYGMTEATVVTHANREGMVRFGTVGRVIPPQECKIADDGEVLIRGPWVFPGYYKDEAATLATITSDGWLMTGDVGHLDDDGFLRITDRKKHLIITSGGKNLSPANIEAAIKAADPLLSHVFPVGDNRPFVTALLVPSPLETLEWGAEHGVLSHDEKAERTRELLQNPAARSPALDAAMARVTKHPELAKRLVASVRRGNQHLAHVETIRRFAILDRDFSQEQGDMTPSMKVRRREILTRYGSVFSRLYDDADFGYSV
jgi:long-chain acyl-CoA synthetase